MRSYSKKRHVRDGSVQHFKIGGGQETSKPKKQKGENPHLRPNQEPEQFVFPDNNMVHVYKPTGTSYSGNLGFPSPPRGPTGPSSNAPPRYSSRMSDNEEEPRRSRRSRRRRRSRRSRRFRKGKKGKKGRGRTKRGKRKGRRG